MNPLFYARSGSGLIALVFAAGSEAHAAAIRSVQDVHARYGAINTRASSGSALYTLSAGGQLSEYDFTGNLLGQLHLSDASGVSMCGDRSHVYVVDPAMGYSYQSIERFRIGSTKPSLVINPGSDSAGSVASSCAVDLATQDVAVIGNYCYSGCIGDVLIYHAGQLQPYYYQRVEYLFYLDIGNFGPDDTLWVAGLIGATGAYIASEASGFYPEAVTRDQSYGYISGIQVGEHRNLLLEDAHDQQIDIYPHGNLERCYSHVCGTVVLTGTSNPSDFQLTPSHTELFTLDGGNVEGFSYPAGGQPLVIIKAAAFGFTIAEKRSL